MKRLSILLVDDKALLTPLLKQFLQHHPSVQVRPIGKGGETVQGDVDVLLVNLCAPIGQSLEQIARLRAQYRTITIVALVPQPADHYGAAALAAGANSFVARSTMSSELLPRLQLWFPALRRDRVATGPHRALTQAQQERPHE